MDPDLKTLERLNYTDVWARLRDPRGASPWAHRR